MDFEGDFSDIFSQEESLYNEDNKLDKENVGTISSDPTSSSSLYSSNSSSYS